MSDENYSIFEDVVKQYEQEPEIPEEPDTSSFNTSTIDDSVPEESPTEEEPEANLEEEEKPEENDIPPWIGQLKNEMKTDKELVGKLKGFKTISQLVNKYMETEEKLSDSLVVPKKGAPKEEIDKFLDALGRPKSPEDYDVGEFKTEEGEQIDKAFRDPLLEAMQEAGLTVPQGKYVYSKLNSILLKKYEIEKENQEEAAAETEEYLRLKWGDNYEKNTEMMVNAIEKFGGPEFLDELNGTKFANSKAFARFMHNIGKAISEEEFVGGETVTSRPAERPMTLSYPSMQKKEGE